MKFATPKLVIIKLTILLFVFVIFILYFYLNNPSSSTLRINEISFENNGGSDWVEIYNPSIHTLSLQGMYLTDNKMDLGKFRVEDNIIIEPRGFVVLYGKNYESEDTSITRINFGIKNGETLYLIDKNSLDTIDSFTVLTNEEASPGSTIGRFPDGSENTFLMDESSMGERNKKAPLEGVNKRP